MIAIRGSALPSARTRQLPRAARSCRGNESSFASFSFSFLASPFSSPHLPSPNAVLLLPLIAKTDPTRGLQPRESPCGIYYEAVGPLRNTRIFERETFHSKYFKLRKPNKYFCPRGLKSEFYDPTVQTLFPLNL